VFLFACWAIAAWRDGSYPRLSARRKVAAGALALTLVLSLVPSLRHVRHRAYGLAPAEPNEPPQEAPVP
jgi:hypothetical protein